MRLLPLNIKNVLVLAILLFLLVLVIVSPVLAAPSQGFYKSDSDVYDSFGICRTDGRGVNGYFQFSQNSFDPIITRESLGENIDVAWEIGESFIDKYPEPNQRAQQIFYFVRDIIKSKPKNFFSHVGKEGTITEILPAQDGTHYYQVRISGETWKAKSVNQYQTNEKCKIIEQDKENMILTI